MGRMNALYKPGEKAHETGTYYCYVCSRRNETSTCEVKQGQLFLACPRCLERKVPEWDLVWKPEKHRPGRRHPRSPSVWPGALSRPT